MSLKSLSREEAVQTAVCIGVVPPVKFPSPTLFLFNRQQNQKTCNALLRWFLIGVFKLDAS